MTATNEKKIWEKSGILESNVKDKHFELFALIGSRVKETSKNVLKFKSKWKFKLQWKSHSSLLHAFVRTIEITNKERSEKFQVRIGGGVAFGKFSLPWGPMFMKPTKIHEKVARKT